MVLSLISRSHVQEAAEKQATLEVRMDTLSPTQLNVCDNHTLYDSIAEARQHTRDFCGMRLLFPL